MSRRRKAAVRKSLARVDPNESKVTGALGFRIVDCSDVVFEGVAVNGTDVGMYVRRSDVIIRSLTALGTKTVVDVDRHSRIVASGIVHRIK